MQLASLAQYAFRVRAMCLCRFRVSPVGWSEQPVLEPRYPLAGALVYVVDMPHMQRVPNVPAVKLARPDLDQTKTAMVVESTLVIGSGQGQDELDISWVDCGGT
jgi:uncharacterized membrane protein